MALISKEDLLTKFETGALLFQPEVKRIIKIQPAVDAVPVVRCKDCKHLFDGEHNANCCAVLMEKAKWITEITVDENGYCYDGKRRDDDCI